LSDIVPVRPNPTPISFIRFLPREPPLRARIPARGRTDPAE
jgi:hypothetical protein